MNHVDRLTYQNLGDPLFETYPWRFWIPKQLLSHISGTKKGWVDTELRSSRLKSEVAYQLGNAGIEFRTFQFPNPNIRFRTEADAMYFILRFCQ